MRSVLLAAVVLSGAAYAGSPGEPGSGTRQRWCAAQLAACDATAKKPGFLGGPLNYCAEASDAKTCVSICEIKWGTTSACLTAADPKPSPQ